MPSLSKGLRVSAKRVPRSIPTSGLRIVVVHLNSESGYPIYSSRSLYNSALLHSSYGYLHLLLSRFQGTELFLHFQSISIPVFFVVSLFARVRTRSDLNSIFELAHPHLPPPVCQPLIWEPPHPGQKYSPN
jgi:hypothetical protein